MTKVEESHTRDVQSMKDLATEQSQQVQELILREQELHAALVETSEVNGHLNQELLATQQVLDNANKTVVLKVSCRLKQLRTISLRSDFEKLFILIYY